MSELTTIYTWLLENPHIWVPVLVYVLWNVIPRTPPADRRLFALWALAERLMLLSWDRWAGSWKSIGVIYPDPEKWADEAVTRKEGKP